MRLIKSCFSLFFLLLLCSCAVQKKKSKSETITDFKQGAQVTSSTSDTSKKTTTERWRVTFPSGAPAEFSGKDLPKFEPSLITDLSGVTAEQKQAIIGLQGKYNSLQGSYTRLLNAYQVKDAGAVPSGLFSAAPPDLFPLRPWDMILEFERITQENNYKSSELVAKDSTEFHKSEVLESKEKDQNIVDVMFLVAVLLLVSFVIGYFFNSGRTRL